MVHADDPQRILAAQAFVADEHVLQRIVERMADVQRAGDVRRRIDDRERRRVGTRGAKQPAAFPLMGPFRLDGGGIEGFFHRHRRRALPAVVRRSEEHTSELQSLMPISYAVFCLKKKKKKRMTTYRLA